jgi:hypothetical protein
VSAKGEGREASKTPLPPLSYIPVRHRKKLRSFMHPVIHLLRIDKKEEIHFSANTMVVLRENGEVSDPHLLNKTYFSSVGSKTSL